MRISLDGAVNGQFKVPKFRVELRNVGGKDLLLNLGAKIRDGRRQYLTAVSLVLLDAQQGAQWLELPIYLVFFDAQMKKHNQSGVTQGTTRRLWRR
jgi:hypothetical protein